MTPLEYIIVQNIYIYNTCVLEAIMNGNLGDYDNIQYDPSISKRLQFL